MKSDLDYFETPKAPRLPPATPEAAEWLRECVSVLDGQIEELATKRKVFLQLIRDAEAEEVTGGSAAAPASPPPRAAYGVIPPDIDLTGLYIDLEGTQNTLERIIKIAEVVPEDKYLNVSQMARYIINAGYSVATVQNMRVAVQRVISRQPDLFDQVRPATYRFRGDKQSKQTAPSLDIPEEPENE